MVIRLTSKKCNLKNQSLIFYFYHVLLQRSKLVLERSEEAEASGRQRDGHDKAVDALPGRRPVLPVDGERDGERKRHRKSCLHHV